MTEYQKQSLDKAIDDLVYSNGGKLQVECLIDLVEKIYQQSRTVAIDEFADKVIEFGMADGYVDAETFLEIADMVKEKK